MKRISRHGITTMIAIAMIIAAMLTLSACGDDGDGRGGVKVDFGKFEDMNSSNKDRPTSNSNNSRGDNDNWGDNNNTDNWGGNNNSDNWSGNNWGSNNSNDNPFGNIGNNDSEESIKEAVTVIDVASITDMSYLDVMGKTRDEIFEFYPETYSCVYDKPINGYYGQIKYSFNNNYDIEILLDQSLTAVHMVGKFPINGTLGLPDFFDVSISYGYEYYVSSNPYITHYSPLDYYDNFTFATDKYTFSGTIDPYEMECWFTSITTGGIPDDPIRALLKSSPLCDPNSLFVHTFADITHDGIEDMISVYGVSNKGYVVVTDASSGKPVEIFRDNLLLETRGDYVVGNSFDYLLYYEKGEAYLFKTGLINIKYPDGDYHIFYLDSSGEKIIKHEGLYGNKDKYMGSKWNYVVQTEGVYRKNAKELLTSIMGLSYFTNQISDKDISELKAK